MLTCTNIGRYFQFVLEAEEDANKPRLKYV